MIRIFSAAKKLFAKKPLLVNCIAYGSLYAGAELTQQFFYKRLCSDTEEKLDLAHIGRYALLGSTLFPVGLFYWYKWLDRHIVGTTVRTLVLKVVIDQVVTMPPILYVFYVGMSFMEGERDVHAEFKDKFWSTFWTTSIFWMPAQYINFVVLPTSMRLIYIASTSFIEANILCLFKRWESDPIVAIN